MKLGLHRLEYVSKALRCLPAELPGKTRLAKKLLGSCLQAKDIKVVGRDGITFVIPSLREPVGFYLLIDGIYEVTTVSFVLKQLKPGAVFIDVGANIGVFTLPAARKIGPAGRVVAIEPSPRAFSYLQQNVALNELSNVHLFQCVATECDGRTMPFYEAPIDHFGMGSLGTQFHTNPILVQARTLDQILSAQKIEYVDVIKVDVEGFEAAVFRGAEKLLTSTKPPIVVFEFCEQVGAAQRVLKDYGYSIWSLKELKRGMPPLKDEVTSGFAMLVACKAPVQAIEHSRWK
jgi:FkbM family methyltransferase